MAAVPTRSLLPVATADRPGPLAGRAAPGPVIALPPAFEAFYALHFERYLGYTLAHVDEPAASRALGEAVGEVVIRWADIVRRPNPAAYAWTLFRTRIRTRGTTRVRSSRPAGPNSRHTSLGYDVFVLHEVLGYTVEEAAEVMGEEVSRVRCVLAAGRRVAASAGRALPTS
ncbi:hypothetical protein GCM10010211_27150 [Streptomyces albospinus]|uniref:Uncharacterized protein n=1 Tax=Streptomyces albospinus TaxID=285515 RepID=A0ABQ2UYV5_9ACTN|nr:hypothetical protein [Streptomyces albospinus]GGU60861.1 hypothetical protein GCM10010211_27150 [Streptomyces albospinus]